MISPWRDKGGLHSQTWKRPEVRAVSSGLSVRKTDSQHGQARQKPTTWPCDRLRCSAIATSPCRILDGSVVAT